MPARDPATQIADALARLRLGRRGGPPWHDHGAHDHGGHEHGHGAHQRGFGPHGGHGFGPGGRGSGAGPAALGRGMARLRLLEVLADADGALSVGAIAERMGVDQPRASRLVQAVVETGQARREADPADARRTLLALTDDGRALVDQTRGSRAAAVEQALAGFDPAERAQLAALLARLADAWPR